MQSYMEILNARYRKPEQLLLCAALPLYSRPGGRIAQVVEQLTLNQRVQGSSPCAPTNIFNDLAEIFALKKGAKTPVGNNWVTNLVRLL